MIIDTKLDISHKELMSIFFKANDLVGVVIHEYPHEINNRFHMCLRFEVVFDESAEKLTFMGIRNCGILNMFDHYLLRCGVHPDELWPKSMYRQEQEEKEEALTKKFMEEMKTMNNIFIKKFDEYTHK